LERLFHLLGRASNSAKPALHKWLGHELRDMKKTNDEPFTSPSNEESGEVK
jgi:hypothetical protein